KTSKSLGVSISVRDSCMVALQTKQTEFEKYKAYNDRTVDYDKLEGKLNEALGQLAHKDIVIREGLKTKAYELSVVKEKHNELMKQSLLTKSHYEGLVKQKTKVITDLKLKEEHDIEKMLSMEKQLKFLNEIVYKRSQSIQTIHMMAPKVSTYNDRPTFANPRYLKQAQSEIPCLYAYPYDQSTHANRLIPDGEETLAHEKESRTKFNKDLEIVDNAWIKHSKYLFRAPTAQDMEILIQTCLMPLAFKTQSDSLKFVHELKQEMHADLKTSSNFKNKNVDTTPRLKNDNQSGQFGNQRMVNVVVARKNVRSKVVQQSGIQCFKCKEYRHFAKECKNPKRVKDSAYHKEKMLLCKQAEQGVPLQAEQYDWLADTDEEVDKQELEAHYSYMAKI
nr:hypothetical protein [Tanacetum cinerariifolium]